MITLVDMDWVAARLEAPGTLVLDIRGRMAYLRGHLRGALNLPAPQLMDDGMRLHSLDRLAKLFGDVGVTPSRTVVLYDSYDGQKAAFTAWALEYLGHQDVCIMSVFYDQWQGKGREVFYKPVSPQPQTFTPQVNPGVRAAMEDVRNAEGEVLLDLRSVEEYRGQAEGDARPGHIPGAVNVVWRDLVGKDGQVLAPAADLRERLRQAGVPEKVPVISYCRVGMRAAVGYLALQQIGHPVRLYDGSYAEWAGRQGAPVER